MKSRAVKKPVTRRVTRASASKIVDRGNDEEKEKEQEEKETEEGGEEQRSQFDEDLDLGTFSCPDAKERFEQFKGRYALPDKGFHPKVVEEYTFISEVIKEFGWEQLCKVPPKHNIDWVREFYAEVAVTPGDEVMVRGTKVSYSATTINSLLKLTPPVDSVYNKMMRRASANDARRILDVIACPGADWKDPNSPSRTLLTMCLKPKANVWFHFIRHTIMPTGHDTSLIFERCVLVYSVMERKPFNVGQVMNTSIKNCTEKPKGELWHPALIHALMERAGVKQRREDESVSKKVVMDKLAVTRIINNQIKKRNDQPRVPTTGTTAGNPSTSAAAPQGNSLDGAAIVLLLKMMEENQKKLMERLDDQEAVWEEKLKTQKEDLVKVFEEKEEEMKKKLTDQERLVKELRRDVALHRQWEKKKDDVVRSVWEQNNAEAAKNLPKYPEELIQRQAEVLQEAAAPTHTE